MYNILLTVAFTFYLHIFILVVNFFLRLYMVLYIIYGCVVLCFFNILYFDLTFLSKHVYYIPDYSTIQLNIER